MPKKHYNKYFITFFFVATRPTNEDDEDEFNRRRRILYRTGMYEEDDSYMNYYNNYPGQYNSFYQPSEFDSDEYYF